MTIYVGGLRARLMRDSLYRMLNTAITDLGWYDPHRKHAPVTFSPDELKNLEAIQPNSAALVDTTTTESEDEMGSYLTEHRWVFYVDFYGENDAVAIHFSTDIKDILGGRMPSIGRSRPNLVVYDNQQPVPPEIFTCAVENIRQDRGVMAKPYKHSWYTVRFDVVDHYGSEND